MTRIRQRTSLETEHCLCQSQRLCDRILAQATSPAELHAYAAALIVRAVETVLPAGDRALFLTHLARHRQARGRGPEADQARAAAAHRLDLAERSGLADRAGRVERAGRVDRAGLAELPAVELHAWLTHLIAVPSAGPGRTIWLTRHLHRALGRLGVSATLEGELARALAWRYLTGGLS